MRYNIAVAIVSGSPGRMTRSAIENRCTGGISTCESPGKVPTMFQE